MDAQQAADVWATLAAVRRRAPLVHSVTNLVVTNLTANVLLASGASPVMVEGEEEVAEMAAKADALVLNVGTMSAARAEAMALAAAAADGAGRPWVLDPVGVGALAYRTDVARRLLAFRPAAIKGNASEVLALAGAGPGGRGVDSAAAPEAAVRAACRLARETGAVVAVTGPVDHATDGARVVEVRNGHPLMARVTGMGCSAAALAGACLAVRGRGERLAAVAHALALLGLAGETAADRGARGPASLQTGLIDALHGFDEPAVLAGARMARNHRHGFDPTLCLVTDPRLVGQRPVEDVALAAARGGATLVQLRDKTAPTRALLDTAGRLKAALAPLGVPLLVNDRVDVALAAGADGVHLGQTDMPAAEARQLLGPGAVIGVSVATEADAAGVDRGAVDYVGLGPVFATATKADAPAPLSRDAFAALVRALAPLPVVAIGGVTAGNLAAPVRDGASGIAVVSAVCASPDPEAAARWLREAVEAARAGRTRSGDAPPA